MGRISEFQRGPVRVANVSRGAGAVEGAFAKLAQAGSEIAFRQQETVNKQYVAGKAIELETRAQTRFTEWQKLNADDPLNKTDELTLGLEADLDDLAQDAPSAVARQGLQAAGTQIGLKHVQAGEAWANQQFVLNTGNELKRSGDQLNLQAFNVGDPRLVADQMASSAALDLTVSDALSEQAIKAFREDRDRGIVSNAFQGMIDRGDTNTVRGLLLSGNFDKVLGADEKKRLMRFNDRKRSQGKKITDSVLTKRFTDPWGYLRDVNGVGRADELPGFTPMDFTPRAIENRQQFIDAMNNKHGTNLPVFTPLEATAVIDNMDRGNPEQQVQFLSRLNDTLLPQQFSLVTKQLFEKEPALAGAMGLASEAPDIAARIIRGHQAIKVRGKQAPKTSDLRATFESHVKDSIPESTGRGQAFAAYRALSTQIALERGKDPTTEFLEDDRQDALEQILGPPMDINGERTMSFRDKNGNWIDEDDFEDLIDDLTIEEIQATHKDAPQTTQGPMPLDDIRNARFVMVSDGVYVLQNENGQSAARSGFRLPTGQVPVFRLDLRKIWDRRPPPKSIFGKIKETVFGEQ